MAQTISDEAKSQIDKQIDPVIAAMKEGDSVKAVTGFFSTSRMLRSEDASLVNLSNQLSNAISLYGRVTKCSLVQWDLFSELVASKQMVCTHEKYATRWKFSLIKLPSGWSAASMIFDSSVDAGPF